MTFVGLFTDAVTKMTEFTEKRTQEQIKYNKIQKT